MAAGFCNSGGGGRAYVPSDEVAGHRCVRDSGGLTAANSCYHDYRYCIFVHVFGLPAIGALAGTQAYWVSLVDVYAAQARIAATGMYPSGRVKRAFPGCCRGYWGDAGGSVRAGWISAAWPYGRFDRSGRPVGGAQPQVIWCEVGCGMGEHELMIFGNKDLPQRTPERPLVTFAVFAYNQESFIRDAIEGAFAQTYEPLEIILSDDCSDDETFLIMQQMAAAYRGPHKVVVRKNHENLGVLGHVLTVAKMAAGKYMVVAAGDDISFPDRTERQVSFLERESDRVVVVSSHDVIFDENCDLPNQKQDSNLRLRKQWYKNNNSWFHGGTACYRLGVLRELPLPTSRLLYEDMALINIFKAMGYSSGFMEIPTIRRRFHQLNLGMQRPERNPWDEERRILRRIEHAADVMDYAADVIEGEGGKAAKLRVQAAIMRKYAKWPDLNFVDRFLLFFESLKAGYMRKASAKVLLGKDVVLDIRSLWC